jgi:hypothetical protein
MELPEVLLMACKSYIILIAQGQECPCSSMSQAWILATGTSHTQISMLGASEKVERRTFVGDCIGQVHLQAFATVQRHNVWTT